MDVANRIIMLLLGVAALVFGVVALLLLGGLIEPSAVSPGGILLEQWRALAHLGGPDATAATIVAIVLAAIGLLVVILEMRPGQREPGRYTIRRDGLGTITVARKSVRALVQYEAAGVPGVMEVDPEVRNRRDGLHILTRTSLAPEVDAAAVGQQLQEKIQAAVQRHIGLPVAEVQVATQVESLDGHARRIR